MSTGVFGAQSSSPLGSTSVFGASSSPAFGSSTPTFGASSGSAFGNSSSAFGGSSVFGQKPAFGGFGSSTTQTSPFGGSFQQSQPAFGSNLFGSSTPFGAPSQPAFGSSSSPAFGAQTTPAFGGTSTPAFGSTASPAFGSTSGGFGVSSSPFGSSTPAFGASSTPAFGASSTPAFGATASAFGATSSPAFGATSSPAFGATSSPAFGASATPAFGASSTPSFNFGSSPAFGQSTSTFGSSPFGATSSFGAQTASFGAQTTTPTFGSSGFGQSTFGGQRGGSRVSPYSATPETDGATGTQPAGKLESISAMPVYKDKSHEELRWEDYQLGDKGGAAPASQATSVVGFGSSGFEPLFSSPGFGTSSASAFGSSPFGASNTSNLFGSTSSATPSLFGSTTQAFGANTSPSLFSSSSTSAFGSPSIFGPTSAQGTASAFGTGLGFGNTQSSPLFQSTTPTLAQTSSPFGQTSSAFGQTAPGFGQSNLFSTPSTGFGGNLFSNTSSLLNSSNTLGFGQTTLVQVALAAPLASLAIVHLDNRMSGTQSSVVAQVAPITNPFGTLPAMPQMSIGRTGASPSIQYGISSLPLIDQKLIIQRKCIDTVILKQVVERPAPVRISSLLTSRHLSQRRLRLPVPFFNDDEETPSTPKADALFVPRENPRALVIRPLEQWHSRSSAEKTNATDTPVHENGKHKSLSSPHCWISCSLEGIRSSFLLLVLPLLEVMSFPHRLERCDNDVGYWLKATLIMDEELSQSKVRQDVYNSMNGHHTKDKDAVLTEDSLENGLDKEQINPVKANQKTNGVHDGEKGDSYITLTGHRAGEAAIVYEHGADIEALMPKLRHSDYFTEPRIQELAAKERAEPGFCRHVKDFVVGRHGYGSIKFFGETDVRRLDLESLIQFNNREVIVYMDESKKPPVGQGLNKPAEVTLLNIKCFDKKTGQQFTEGPRIEKYKEMLKRKAEDQGAEFVSYDPLKGEWKFRVNHFSEYKLGDENESDENLLSPMS
ncbi:hypothetical protein DH2020_020433 [Rehmannia glutinosa]|uniref:Peptidase S59 domain-containing protein n=1 Tax=Rehmannia glutinosa TaxID=99300 RepID=A0ABR0WJM5_REHGL